MDKVAVVEVVRDSVIVILIIVGPLLVVAMLVGLTIAIFQTLTSIQEMTLTYVPVIVAVLVSTVVFLPFMMGTMVKFGQRLLDRIIWPSLGLI